MAVWVRFESLEFNAEHTGNVRFRRRKTLMNW